MDRARVDAVDVLLRADGTPLPLDDAGALAALGRDGFIDAFLQALAIRVAYLDALAAVVSDERNAA